MTKKLNTENITNELEGASLFFTKSPTSSYKDIAIVEKEIEPATESSALASVPAEQVKSQEIKRPKTQKTRQLSNSGTVIPRHHRCMV